MIPIASLLATLTLSPLHPHPSALLTLSPTQPDCQSVSQLLNRDGQAGQKAEATAETTIHTELSMIYQPLQTG